MPKAPTAAGTSSSLKTGLNTLSTGQTCSLTRKIQGTLTKQPAYIYREGFEVKDLKNNYTAKVNFIETKSQSRFGGFFGGKKEDKRPRNQIEIKIVKVHGGNEVPLMIGSGNWVRYVQFAEEYTWKYTDKFEVFKPESGPNVLPSSSINRKELGLIAEKKYTEADKIVEKVEAQELKDEKNRKKFVTKLSK